MTINSLKQSDRLRHLAMLLAVLCGFAIAHAQLESDDINTAILVEGSVPVKWTNDTEYPWYVPEGESYVRTPEAEGAVTTILEGTYSSSYPTEITLSEYRSYSSSSTDYLMLEIDGEQKFKVYGASWTARGPYMIPAGTHTLKFTAYCAKNAGYSAGIRNLRIWECKELASACLTANSLPITFENESDIDNMWVTEDGYIRSAEGTSAKTSTTFTIDKASIFAYEVRKGKDNSYTIAVYIDGIEWNTYSSTGWSSSSIVLNPGTHTIDFIANSANQNYLNSTQLRNIRLEQNWYDVTLNSPGELGTRLTQVMEGLPIQNMELLKIRGAMNSDDWEKIKLLTGIKAIDFTDTGITGVPANACQNLKSLSTVMLPETVKSIGNYAFKGTNFYQISIPASVETIGNDVWTSTPLTFISFQEDSRLTSIDYGTFYETRLIEFYMPNTVLNLGVTPNSSNGSMLFYNCRSLRKLHLSEGLTILPKNLASYCNNLTELNLPVNTVSIGASAFSSCNLESVTIPRNVVTMGKEAFSSNSNLKEVYLNSHCWNMDNTFVGCTALQKIVLPCATPPTISKDPFSTNTKNSATLVVPDFAFDTYRSNSYWYQFRNTVKGDEASINEYWALRGTLNLNNSLVMRGNPSVEMMEGSVMTLDDNSTQSFNEFTYNTGETKPAVVFSQSNSVNADRLVSKFYVGSKDKWFFFSPVTDVRMSDVSYPSTDSWVIRYYDGARRASENATSGNWVNVPSDGILKSGQGYIIQAREVGWLYLPAISAEEHDKFFGCNQVTFELADNPCETEANAGWNFVANPYPTYYDIYYIDMQAPITVWNGSTYRAYSLNDGDRGDDTFVLRPMQPFFVQKSSADLKTGMPLVGRQVNTTIDRSRAPRPVVVDENRHKLNLELFCNDNETADDYTRVVINEDASLAYETVRDASKFMSMNPDVAQLYTLSADGHPMAINERPYEDGNVALGVLLPAVDRTYRIAALRADRKAWIYDAETGIEQDLTEGDYIFTASKTGIDNKRFSIRFAPSVNAVEGVEASAVKVTGNVGSISVTAPADATVAVYGIDGSVIATATAGNGSLEFAVAGGVYVVKVNGESFKTIVK